MVIAVSVHSCLLLKTLFSLYTWKIEVVWRRVRAWRRKKYHWRSCFLQSLYVWDVPEKETKQLRSEWVALISPFGPTNQCKKDSIDRWSTLTEVCTLALYSKLLVSSKKRTPLSGAHGFVKMRWLIRRHGHYWPTVLSDCIAHAKSCDACQRYRLSASRLPSYTRLSSLGHFEVGPRNSELIFADMLSENTSQPQYQDGLRLLELELCCTTSCCDHCLS